MDSRLQQAGMEVKAFPSAVASVSPSSLKLSLQSKLWRAQMGGEDEL